MPHVMDSSGGHTEGRRGAEVAPAGDRARAPGQRGAETFFND